MKRRTMMAAISGMVLTAGCYSSDNKMILEVRRVNETAENARITEYSCVKTAGPLRRTFSKVGDSQTGEARMEVTESEVESVRLTLDECYDSDKGPAYVRFDEAIYKVNFLKQQ